MKSYTLLIAIFLMSFCAEAKAQNIHKTACDGDLERLDSLLSTTDIDFRNNTESTPLHVAIFCRKEEVFELLMKKGASVHAVNNFGDTPLFYGAQVGNVIMVEALIAKGASVNTVNKEGMTPLFRAVQSNNEELFEILIAAGADVNIGTSPLHRAVLNENFNFIKKLVNEETNLDELNDRGNTPLAIAMRQKSVEIAEFLLSKGADRNKVRTFDLRGDYLGQTKPGLTASIFAPGVVSTEDFTHTPSFSPDGKQLYYTAESRKYHGGTIMMSEFKNGEWTIPGPAPIEGDFREIDPFVSPDGTKMFYSSNRPINDGDSASRNIDMWMAEKEGQDWGIPKHLGDLVNTEFADWFPTVSSKGTLFFSTGPGRSSNIVYSEFKNGKYQKSISLGDSVNSENRDYDPVIAPDESYVIFSSNRPGGIGSVDIYISFKNEDGSWGKAKNMGEAVNTDTGEFAPRLSHDGKFFFFNRRGDIYWIDAKVIENLR